MRCAFSLQIQMKDKFAEKKSKFFFAKTWRKSNVVVSSLSFCVWRYTTTFNETMMRKHLNLTVLYQWKIYLLYIQTLWKRQYYRKYQYNCWLKRKRHMYQNHKLFNNIKTYFKQTLAVILILIIRSSAFTKHQRITQVKMVWHNKGRWMKVYLQIRKPNNKYGWNNFRIKLIKQIENCDKNNFKELKMNIYWI